MWAAGHVGARRQRPQSSDAREGTILSDGLTARANDLPPFTQLASLTRDAYYASGELVPLLDDNDQVNRGLAGRISCDQIVPYPPGIPVLVSGQRITDNIVKYLVRFVALVTARPSRRRAG